MTFNDFILAYLLTGCLFVVRIMGTHNSNSKTLRLFGNRWTVANFKDQFSLHPIILFLTLVAVVTWLLGFIQILINEYQSNKSR